MRATDEKWKRFCSGGIKSIINKDNIAPTTINQSALFFELTVVNKLRDPERLTIINMMFAIIKVAKDNVRAWSVFAFVPL